MRLSFPVSKIRLLDLDDLIGLKCHEGMILKFRVHPFSRLYVVFGVHPSSRCQPFLPISDLTKGFHSALSLFLLSVLSPVMYPSPLRLPRPTT